MKKYLLLLSILFITSCQQQKTFEDSVIEQMKMTVKELAKNPESVSFSNIETKFLNDSICVLHFTLRGQNSFGGYNASQREYIYTVNSEGVCYERLRNLKEDGSILDRNNNIFESFLVLSHNIEDITTVH